MDKNEFKEKHILVTGGTRSFGKGITERFLEYGGDVTITGRKENGNTIEGCNYKAIDFSDRVATANFAEWVKNQNFDIIINNAGINLPGSIESLAVDEWDKVINVNLHAPMLICKAAIPYMKEKGWGRIVNLSSIYGKVGSAGCTSYTASKFGIDGLTVSIALEVAKYGIIANCVAPSQFLTDMTKGFLDEEGLKKCAETIPIKRLGEIDELAKFVIWLSSSENTYVSAQNIAIDGGFTRQ